MKPAGLLLLAGLITGLTTNAQEATTDSLPKQSQKDPFRKKEITGDTTFLYQDKTIRLTEEQGQVKVNVFESTTDNDTAELKPVYEGVFSDEKSYEKYTVAEDLGFQFPVTISKKKKRNRDKMEGHWAGFGVGLSNIATADYTFARFDGYRLNADKSYEWILNTNEFIVPLITNCFGLTTGLGLTWRNYVMEDNVHLEELGGIIQVVPADAGITYKSSRLRTLHVTAPLFLEWQPNFGNNHDIFITAGVVGGIKAFANHKIKYEENDDMIKLKTASGSSMNMPPLTLDYMVQAGIKDISIYAKYSPFGLFRTGEGPDAHAISIGFMLNFSD